MCKDDCDWNYFMTMIGKEEIFHRGCPDCGHHDISFFGYWLTVPQPYQPYVEYTYEFDGENRIIIR